MAKTALLVFELQNDYLWEKRKEKFPYDTEKLIAAVNAAVGKYQDAGCDIVYLAQIFPDTPTNHLVFGFCIEQTEGAKLYSGLKIAAAQEGDAPLYFEKNVADAFLSKPFAAYAAKQGYDTLLLCGIDENGSIAATAKSALQRGIKVQILKDCTASRFPMNKLAPLRAELKAMGAEYISA